MSDIKSPFRMTAKELGKAVDQTACPALSNYGCRAYWPFGGSVKPDGRMGMAYEGSSFTIWRADKAQGNKINAFRNVANQDSPAYWATLKEFQPLPKTIPEYNWFPPVQWYNNLKAARQDAYLDTRRYLPLSWGVGWRTPAGTTDNGILIDDDATGISGYEILGLRPSTPFDRLQINTRAGAEVIYEGHYIFDGGARRTADNTGKYLGRGMGAIPKRVGILTADDLINGWNEAKALVLPNVQFGPKATFVAPASRIEHLTTTDRYKDHPTDIYPAGNDPRMVPHGTRFVLNMSRAKFEAWADAQGFTGILRKTAEIIWIGCSDYGLIVSETGSGDNTVESEGAVNPEAKAKLDSIGITSAAIAGRMFRGLFVPGNFYVANPSVLFV